MSRRTLLARTAAVLGLTGAALAGTAGAAQAAPVPWTASYQAGTAQGTTNTTSPGWPTLWAKDITGSVTSSAAAECYRVQLVVNRDLVPQFVTAADHCGTGSTTFTRRVEAMFPTTSVSVRVCRLANGTVSGCGTATAL
jgi:hypothetical protein